MNLPLSNRYVVSAFDYDLWQVVVEAGSRLEARRKAEMIYLADGFGSADAFAAAGSDLRWHVQPLVLEVRS